MITDKNYDHLLMGPGHWPLLEGIILKKQNKKVVIIEDDRVHLGNMWSCQVGAIDQEILRLIGQRYHIAPLLNLNRYLRPSPHYFILNQVSMLQGGSFEQNIWEILRKFPGVYQSLEKKICFVNGIDWEKEKSAFKDCVKLYTSWLLEDQAYRGSFLEKIDLLPPVLKNIFQYFLNKNFESRSKNFLPYLEKKAPENHFFFQWLTLCQTFYHFKLTNWAYQNEIVHFLITSLLPRYELDQEALEHDLKAEFLNIGGRINKTHIDQWFVERKKIKIVELNSFEGLLYPHKIKMYGQFDPRLPFRLKSDFSPRRSIKLKWQCSSDLFKGIENRRFVKSDFMRSGTDLPCDIIHILDKHTIVFEGIVGQSHLAPKDYQLSLVKANFYQFLIKFFGHHELVKNLKGDDFERCDSYDQWLDLSQLVWDGIENRKKWTFQPSLYFIPRPGRHIQLANLDYSGPLCYLGLGPLACYKDLYKKFLAKAHEGHIRVLQENLSAR